MSKYTHTLDMSSDNSAALILKNVKPNTTVLEFGPGNGYMTQYLKESLNCKVSIVEIDSAGINDALKYVSRAFIGTEFGDIEKYHWINDKKYDHIIFADVLEHLYVPWKVLQEAVNAIKNDGTILISIPNIGHNSILIDLLNGKFNYRELGLLDNTHIRFFTRESLEKMISDAGLYISKEMNTFCAIEHTEFQNTLEGVPQEVANFLIDRPDGILYQFVWELKKNSPI